MSLPTRGAWIEISSSRCSRGVLRVAPHAGSVDRNCRKNRQAVRPHPVAPHAGSVDRNFFSSSVGSCRFVSLPTRGAWIEILDGSRTARRALTVAPHAGSVDRNLSTLPRKAVKTRVAPHAGSVDRNSCTWRLCFARVESLPTRGAWIEIMKCQVKKYSGLVAPHAGSVDRNVNLRVMDGSKSSSLPTRGAWIEIAYVS